MPQSITHVSYPSLANLQIFLFWSILVKERERVRCDDRGSGGSEVMTVLSVVGVVAATQPAWTESLEGWGCGCCAENHRRHECVVFLVIPCEPGKDRLPTLGSCRSNLFFDAHGNEGELKSVFTESRSCSRIHGMSHDKTAVLSRLCWWQTTMHGWSVAVR